MICQVYTYAYSASHILTHHNRHVVGTVLTVYNYVHAFPPKKASSLIGGF